MAEETLGQRLKRLRLARGLSQRDLSAPGVSYAYISRVEAGARTPSVRALRKIAPKLGVTVEYLETGADVAVTDELMSELVIRARSVLRISAVPGRVFIRWKVDGRQLDDEGANLTEALLAAVTRMRRRDELLAEEERLAAEHTRILRI